MSELSFLHAQADMRKAYLCGAPGVLVSGMVWLIAGLVALNISQLAGVYALLVGGVLIHPLSVLLTKMLGSPGVHDANNPMGRLAVEGTFWLLAGIAIAYGMHVLRLEWFFPAMLLLIGGRYLTFQTLYGLRTYWLLGSVLCAVGMAFALARVGAPQAALVGGAIEVVFAVVFFRHAERME